MCGKPGARILGIAFEPGPRRAQAKRVAPGIHIGHDALAADARQGIAKDDLQIAGGIFLGLGIGGIGVDLHTPLQWRDDQMTGFVQERMHRRIATRVDVRTDHAGFGRTPVAAGYRCTIGDLHQSQTVAAQQVNRACE
jgi:hypothetical protein